MHELISRDEKKEKKKGIGTLIPEDQALLSQHVFMSRIRLLAVLHSVPDLDPHREIRSLDDALKTEEAAPPP